MVQHNGGTTSNIPTHIVETSKSTTAGHVSISEVAKVSVPDSSERQVLNHTFGGGGNDIDNKGYDLQKHD